MKNRITYRKKKQGAKKAQRVTNKKENPVKILQVQGFRRLNFKTASNSYTFADIPIIKFGGSWLYQYEFHVGDKIKVRLSPGKIVITKLDTKLKEAK
ncbi:SymE family type I addiction module toxin [Chitinophaga sp. LS1]|uniref:SymE family type I addiction module toxin n=1 Tax=Chitinophaga sp. LS1 TaxID=3051176 RepID=UPI002AAA840C|nr:SymE family type I addiction module toxin [Chitinophaga sp. LS1]WPV70577.1 SymE family type I addiction module toxin [Chitinophaga sp. LS1]